ncbi:hypothetical protein IF090_06635 [Acinetobacter towneri]|uniref:hypothetical protein n=1 Tax=Acinetobacter towneri TaxID=202956 RepID=UPI001CE15B4F|nr:hypothetical protein [Acinetobacter towneri]MCA4779310.1 hypothetical protein [Acinetobacter towneri]MCA4784597.1 hypothetical protein [Acinetobacter towneri]MCA4787401.1 hypothetical protein [Acinetobacter towneri]MCA4795817.1 hypothetical protein [Acinetobacter towneri]MCA4800829.1 hypothetical protein [Acinetobacter towneri]
MSKLHLDLTASAKSKLKQSAWKKAALMLGLTIAASGIYAQNVNQANQLNTAPQKNYTVFAEYANLDADFDSGDTVELDGFALGVSTTPHRSGFYGRLEFLKNNEYDLDYYEFNMGGNLNLISYHGFYFNTYAGLGYSGASSKLLANDVNFVTLPVGVEVGLNFVPDFSIYATAGYKWLYDSTSNTTCKDGTTSDKVGNTACYWNGGIAYYNEYIGDADGVTYNVGMRMHF